MKECIIVIQGKDQPLKAHHLINGNPTENEILIVDYYTLRDLDSEDILKLLGKVQAQQELGSAHGHACPVFLATLAADLRELARAAVQRETQS